MVYIYTENNYCICCHSVIPEGALLCPACELGLKNID